MKILTSNQNLTVILLFSSCEQVARYLLGEEQACGGGVHQADEGARAKDGDQSQSSNTLPPRKRCKFFNENK